VPCADGAAAKNAQNDVRMSERVARMVGAFMIS
jgi:hypothetical protein